MQRRRRKPRRTQLERRNETQGAILSASISLLAKHGYAGFSASRVAAEAGVSRGALEHYFPKKNDLIAAATGYAMREAVERLVGQINGEFGTAGHTPITYLYRKLPPADLVACYRAADVMLVTPLCDGMNLVAKEYVATRFDDTGVLILSEFAGAATELDEALLVNPLDADWMADRLRGAVDLSPGETRRRMAALRGRVLEHDVFAWSSSCLRAIESPPQPA